MTPKMIIAMIPKIAAMRLSIHPVITSTMLPRKIILATICGNSMLSHPLDSLHCPFKNKGRRATPPSFGRFFHRNLYIKRLNNSHSFQNGKHDGCSHDRTHLPSRVGSHGMHQEIILRIIFLPFPLDHSCGHGIGGDPSSSDEWINLSTCQDLHQLSEQNAAGRIETDGNKSKG